MALALSPFFGIPVLNFPFGPRGTCCRARPWGPASTWHGVVLTTPSTVAQAHALDVTEDDSAFKITVDAPGMDASDISVTMEEGVMTVAGKKRSETQEKDNEGRVLRLERRATSFTRSFRVPDSVDHDKIAASLRNGVLEVVLPKMAPAPKPAPTHIPVVVSDASHQGAESVKVVLAEGAAAAAAEGASGGTAQEQQHKEGAQAEEGVKTEKAHSTGQGTAATAAADDVTDVDGAAGWTEVTGKEGAEAAVALS